MEDCYMPDYFNSSHNKISPELQGSVLRGILGSVTGIIVCILVMLLCALFQMSSFSTMLQLFTGLVIGGFYRLFHGRRSKTAAYVTVGICTVLASVLWVALLALLSVFVSPTPFTAADWGRLCGEIWELLLLCVGLGMVGFFLTRRSLLAYADWKRGPWHIAYAGGNGYSYNRKNFPMSTRQRTLPYIAALHREPRSSWSAAASGGGDGFIKIVCFLSMILPVWCWGRGMAVMYSMIRIIRYWLSLQAVWNTQT